jgi:site-specific DNA recombinase
MRTKTLALLTGLLHCECCPTRMVYSYSSKGRRKYPYYVCRNAKQKGWATCPSKSLPARAIEESEVGRIRDGTFQAGQTYTNVTTAHSIAAGEFKRGLH